MNKPYHILVVDDEREMLELIASYLRKENFRVSLAYDGYELIEKLRENFIDLVVLDVMMPGMDGFTACQIIRDTSNVPIIMLTAKGDEESRVKGLKIGADDYIVKPFSPRELVARIEVLLRRTHEHMLNQHFLHVGKITIDVDGRSVQVAGKPVMLTRKEYDLLLLLAKNKGKVFTREQLHDLVWGLDYARSSLRTVDTHIKTLRLKLGEASQYIHTIWGVGYKLEEPVELGEQGEN